MIVLTTEEVLTKIRLAVDIVVNSVEVVVNVVLVVDLVPSKDVEVVLVVIVVVDGVVVRLGVALIENMIPFVVIDVGLAILLVVTEKMLLLDVNGVVVRTLEVVLSFVWIVLILILFRKLEFGEESIVFVSTKDRSTEFVLLVVLVSVDTRVEIVNGSIFGSPISIEVDKKDFDSGVVLCPSTLVVSRVLGMFNGVVLESLFIVLFGMIEVFL